MATDIDPDGTPQADEVATPDAKNGKSKPTKNLPTDRVSKDSQYNILRAYAKASQDQGRAAVSNSDVQRFAGISASSISTCNPFWNDAGLLIREGIKQRPVDAVFAYDQAVEWGSENPGSKLAPVLAASWFGKALLNKLALKPTSRNEALAFLAEECRASPEYKSQVDLLLDYLETAGLISVEGNTVSKNSVRTDAPPPTPPPDASQNDTVADTQKAAAASKKLHPFIQGLIQKLPDPDNEWPLQDRAKWLTTAANIFDLMYTDSGTAGVSVTLTGNTLSLKTGGPQ